MGIFYLVVLSPYASCNSNFCSLRTSGHILEATFQGRLGKDVRSMFSDAEVHVVFATFCS
jgi:hypothetical protein